MEKTTFCVTGASSFLGSHLVKLLLEKGHKVHGTVRSLEKSSFLHSLPHSHNLSLFEADLLVPSTLSAPLKKCSGIFHVAGPWLVQAQWDEHWLPLVEGTKNVLSAVQEVEEIRRVVLVSSVAAVHCVCKGYLNEGKRVFTEEDWNEVGEGKHDEECRKSRSAEKSYFSAKTAAELEAVKWIENIHKTTPNRPLDLIRICPSVVFGPLLSSPTSANLNTSMLLLPGLFYGGDSGGIGITDVRDVASALYQAMVNPKANGRYIISSGSLKYSEISGKLNKMFPERSLGIEEVEDVSVFPVFESERAKRELGVNFRELDVTLRESFESLIEKGCLEM